MFGLPSVFSIKVAGLACAVAFAAGSFAGWQARDWIADVAALKAERAALIQARDEAARIAKANAEAAQRLAADKARQDAAVAALEAERERLAADLEAAREAISTAPDAEQPAGEAIDRALDALRGRGKP